MSENIFLQVLIVFGFTIIVTYISSLLRFPVIISFLISGVIIGPNGLKLISHSSLVNSMAEIGLAMLLFTIGLEFNKEKIKNVRRFFFRGGLLQVLTTLVFFILFFIFFGFAVNQAVFIAFLLTLSSSALGFRILNEKMTTHTPRGNLITGILLFQDVAFVPMLIAIPFLASGRGSLSFPIAQFAVYLFLFLFFFFLIKRYGEKIFRYVIGIKHRELNLMLAIFIPFGFSILSYKLGFSHALGAFIAGVLLSESDFHLQIVSDIIPFKDIFNAFFFIAAGMLFELSSLGDDWMKILLLLAVVMVFKGSVVFGVARIMKFPSSHAWCAAVSLFQLSEFSFALAQAGRNFEIISKSQFNVFFSATIISMLLTPFLIDIAEKYLMKQEKTGSGSDKKVSMTRHTVIAGYGLTGRNLALALQRVHLPFLVVDLNYESIKHLRDRQIEAFFGDISRDQVLDNVNIREASVLVLAVNDPGAVKVAVAKARKKNALLQIIARTRFFSEIEKLHRLGANEVIVEEFETSIEIFHRTLRHYHIPGNVVENIIGIIRNRDYAVLRGRRIPDDRKWEKLNDLIKAGTVETFLIDQDMFGGGKTLKELDLRNRTDATVVAVVRSGKSHPSPRSDFTIMPGDILVLAAAHQNLERAFHYLEKGEVLQD